MGIPPVSLGNITQASADPSAVQMQQAQQAVQSPPQQQPQQAPPDDDPIHQQLMQKAQEALNAKTGVKQILQNFFSGLSHGMVPPSMTPQFKQEKALANLNSYESTKALVGLHQQQAQANAPVPLIGLDGKPKIDPSTGNPITLSGIRAASWYAGQELAASRAQVAQTTGQFGVEKAQIMAGPTVNTTPAMQDMGLPAQTSLRSAGQAQGIIQKQAGTTPVDDQLRSLIPNLPASVTSLPTASLMRYLATTTPQTRSSYEWKETSPGVWEPLPTKAVTTRGFGGGAVTPAPTQPGAVPTRSSTATQPRAGLPGKIYGGGPIAAFNPQTQETQLTTPQEQQQLGLSNPRKVTEKEIEDNRQLNNRLADVAMKITRYEDAINTPVDAADRTFMASLLQSDKFKVGLAGIELPVDKFNQIIDAVHQSQLSPAAQNRLISYFNARESMLGYQRVLAGSARSSDAQLGLNLGALPGPISPDAFAKEGIRQFKDNIPIAGRGLMRIPGVPTAGDILSPKIEFKEGNDVYHIPASRVADFKKAHPQAVPNAR